VKRMPSINRIRVNNVKYNFGTQMYDDFTMRMYGKNTLYDLANGGGKSVLMLLLMQCLIPNSTLDEKQPIEKLFRENCGNTTIHSMVEWKLDPCDIEDGYRYMTTGFTARKAKDRSAEEEKGEKGQEDGVASIDYFNYCIFYREYNKYDIVNLPLVNGNERVTYQSFRNYLSDLKKRDKNVLVYIFDRKGEYQRFISRFGLYESQWEIIRGINKTEGHVRTFFETNYRTTRKVIEDLLIEEIIEKAYLTKVEKERGEEGGGESAAGLLFNIREQLKELAEKKKDINNYDHEISLVELFRDRITSFLSGYQEEEKLAEKLAGIYVTGEAIEASAEKLVEQLEMQLSAEAGDIEKSKERLETIKVSREKMRAERMEEEIREKEQAAAFLSQMLTELEKEYKTRKAEDYYLEYLEEKGKLDTLKIEASTSNVEEKDFVDALRELYLWYRIDLAEVDNQSASLKREKEEAEEALRIVTGKIEEVGVGLAVAENTLMFEEAAAEEIKKKISALEEGLSEVSFETAEQRLIKKKERVEREERQLIFKKEDIQRAIRDEETLETEALETERQKATLETAIHQLEETERDYRENKERLEKIVQIYAPGKDVAAAENTIKKKIERDIIRLAELEQLIEKAEKRAKMLAEGRRIDILPDVQKVIDYIETRHGATAMFGMDYIAAVDSERREQLLALHPELPYSVIAEKFEILEADETLLGQGEGNVAVRIFDRDFLDEAEEREALHSITVGHAAEFFTSDEVMEKLLQEASEIVKSYCDERKYLRDVRVTEEEDLAFVLLHGSKDKRDAKEIREGKEKELEDVLHLLSKKEEQISAKKKNIEDLKAEADGIEGRITVLQKDIQILQELIECEKKLDEKEQELQKARDDRRRYVSMLEKYRPEKQNAKVRVDDLSNAQPELVSKRRKLTETWDEKYAVHYDLIVKDKQPISDGVSPSRKREEVKAIVNHFLKENKDSESGIEERRLLLHTLEKNLERLGQMIEDLGFTLSELEERRESSYMNAPSKERMKELSSEIAAARERAEREKSALGKLREEWVRLNGSIDYAIENMRNAYGDFRLIRMQEDELQREEKLTTERRESQLSAYKNTQQQLEKAKRQKENAKGMFRDAARIIERKGIDTSGAKVLSEEETKDVLEEFEELLFRYDQIEKTIEKNRAMLYKVQGQVYESLLSLGAASLAGSIRDDAKIPENLFEAEELIQNLTSMMELLKLEKERVEKGIEDMEKLKDSFVDSCLERCLDVRTELDKLPKLSQIIIDGDKVPMVKLSIPYVTNDLMVQKMSDYIDHIIEEADALKTEAERKKYMQSELQVKKLFSVIVTDMNRIRLMLYKRERIKEQSRYLRYEEAVGSTGQSQGIYIQFLVSVIHYISGMYSVNSGDSRSKTIFIDNPFGAAKDIYIWEPIFKLLETNQVQLIVPSRGATPEITGRFDVNYVLGQKMYGQKALTVVVNYNSNTKGEELEYRDLEYSQETFDFI